MASTAISNIQDGMTVPMVVVLAPGGFTSGGPELSHQLADLLVRNGVSAHMVYTPLNKSFEKPQVYAKYVAPVMKFADVPKGATIILPEVYTGYLSKLKKYKVLIWWQSVDNYFKSNNWSFAIKNGMMPWQFHDLAKRAFPSHVIGHLAQSEYAKIFLASHGVDNVVHLSDHLNTDYIERLARPVDASNRRDIVVYNPEKGFEQTQQILAHLDGKQAVPIQNMTRDQVIELLASAKVYIDFGNHPGKDRIPREAAALGCCVITNRRGSAANAVDVPIDDIYKIDDGAPDFDVRTAALVRQIFADFPTHQAAFGGYRDLIAGEPASFAKDAMDIFAPLAGSSRQAASANSGR